MSRRAPRSRNTLRIARLLTCFLAASALVVGTVVPATAASASVLSASSTPLARAAVDPATAGIVKTSLVGFNAGNIISDLTFTNDNTMTEAQIQTFFNSKVARCLGGRDEDGKAIVCLKDFRISSVTRPADAYCNGYSGAANETAARIIYRVAKSCNINPQVLIVMLQKEQGLITHTWPSAWRFNIALGQGCPDTAPCDPGYIGFFHQIYGAARQMQIYMEGKWFQWYAPGKTWNILYNPNASCGSSPVRVANKATSALYYYTPYQPNSAALRAGYGEGNGCSAYGNRNFYNYFTDWFGSTQTVDPLGEISRLHTNLGGASGVLGAAGTQPTCTASTTRCTWNYAKGIITWTRGLGPLTVYGDVYREYAAQGGLGGKLGYPTVTPKGITDPKGNGITQQFDKGWIHSSARGTFASSAAVMKAYSAAGWLRGTLGWPISAETCASTKCVQSFAGGVIRHTSGQAAYVVPAVNDAKIKAEYTARGGATGILGYAVTASRKVVDPNGDGSAQQFDGGWIHSSSAGTFTSSSTIMTAYSTAGWVRGAFGWPVGPETCTVTACVQPFQNGALQYTKGGVAGPAAGVTNAAIRKVYDTSGGATGPLGYPLQPAKRIIDPNGNGYAQQFAGGWIHSGPRGTFATSTQTMALYSAAGWLRGSLGWPAGAEKCSDLGCTQAFAKGTITAPTAGSDGVRVTAAIRDLHQSIGGAAGWIGTPLAIVNHVTDPKGSGDAQRFANGWIHSSAKGAFASSTGIMTAYSAAGWVRGTLGWPTTAEAVVTDANGDGVTQQFAGGWIHSSARGAFSSSSVIMKAYSAAGWLRGTLGWPISAETCASGSCSQSFTGGTIRYQTGSAAVVILTGQNQAIQKAYQAAGGAAGFLGQPVAAVKSITDRNGNGFVQQFDGGWIHSSNNGTFTSSTTIMQVYSPAGWLRGSLGWPIGAEACVNGTCKQAFTHGTIRVTGPSEDVFLTNKNAEISRVYTASGGAKGSLGHATTALQTVTDPKGNGFAQGFDGGWIHASARGTFASSAAMMKLYSDRGWIRGSLGWPTSAETCTATTCTQSFAGGKLSYTK